MRILHTADLHLGVKLHGQDLHQEQEMFVNWLATTVKEESIDLVIVAGDIFDVANPSNEASELYYKMLHLLAEQKCKVIITSGNHDSAGHLNAPKSVLKYIDIHIAAAMPEDLHDLLIPVYNKENELELVVAAVPYLKESDLRKTTEGENYDEKILATQAGINNVYREVAALCKSLYPATPVIATGHLFARGVTTSESERLIQVGNQAMVDETTFDEVFSYVALGHIHRPQSVAKQSRIRYSGSPVALSFSEKGQQKHVVILDVTDKNITSSTKEIECFRDLVTITGSLEEIKSMVVNYKNSRPLPAIAELVIEESRSNALINAQISDLIYNTNRDSKELKIALYKIKFSDGSVLVNDASETVPVNELSPQEIFSRRIEQYSPQQQAVLKQAFLELLNEMNEEETK